jgi:hypothetical protein
VIPTLQTAMILARVPERNIWLKITNSPLKIASAGMIG